MSKKLTVNILCITIVKIQIKSINPPHQKIITKNIKIKTRYNKNLIILILIINKQQLIKLKPFSRTKAKQ